MPELVENIEKGVIYEWDQVDRIELIDRYVYNTVSAWIVSEATFKSGEYKNKDTMKINDSIHLQMCELNDAADVM